MGERDRIYEAKEINQKLEKCVCRDHELWVWRLIGAIGTTFQSRDPTDYFFLFFAKLVQSANQFFMNFVVFSVDINLAYMSF